MGNSRALVFRILVLVSGGLLTLSWFMPWWSMLSHEMDSAVVVIRPWGLENNLGTDVWAIEGSAMPEWFIPLIWAYLGLCIACLLYAVIFKDRDIRMIGRQFNLNGFIVGLVGFSQWRKYLKYSRASPPCATSSKLVNSSQPTLAASHCLAVSEIKNSNGSTDSR